MSIFDELIEKEEELVKVLGESGLNKLQLAVDASGSVTSESLAFVLVDLLKSRIAHEVRIHVLENVIINLAQEYTSDQVHDIKQSLDSVIDTYREVAKKQKKKKSNIVLPGRNGGLGQ